MLWTVAGIADDRPVSYRAGRNPTDLYISSAAARTAARRDMDPAITFELIDGYIAASNNQVAPATRNRRSTTTEPKLAVIEGLL